ncbi:MAG: 1,4-alpha-glucan branching protein GlgB [Dichotomicrobium sp.]
MSKGECVNSYPANSDIEAIVAGRHGEPFAVLGPQWLSDDTCVLSVFAPEAERVEAIDRGTGEALAPLERLHPGGFFAGALPAVPPRPDYKLRLFRGDDRWERDDPYRFASILGETDIHLMAEGTHRELYTKLGAHPVEMQGVAGVAFAVWAPNAQRVSVVGDFNGWDGRRHPMRRHGTAGIWDIFIPGVGIGALYKFDIIGPRGEVLPQKADPVALSMEAPPANASRVVGTVRESWRDDQWLAKRGDAQTRSAPISIYEVHLGSWRRGEDGAYFDYDRLARELVTYVKDLGFTHIELLPISEHPFTGSWGYQPIGLFAPTARHGSPDGFARFVEQCHQEGIGVIIDWVPGHFPSDAYGLARFDGTPLYEYADPRRGFHPDWNTLIYDLGRPEVANFLDANALFWLDRYHVDGLRVDAVASMLYLDYSREHGEWVPNVHGGRENLEAIEFLKGMNTRVYSAFPSAITAAEESTAWPMVSAPVEAGGLGFGYKWNMGWMHDTLSYMAQDPLHRRYHHASLTFGLIYAFSENFILPLSHDEVVHGKGSLIGKMPGDRWQKFANLRAYLAFMWTHPGKKLLFMGGEFAQEREWNHDRTLDWNLLSLPEHRGVQDLVRDLNRLYRSLPALHELDCEPAGFDWVEANDAERSVLAYLRKGTGETPPALVVCNFTPVVQYRYTVGVPLAGAWQERLNTDAAHYGGSNVGNLGLVHATDKAAHSQPASLELTLPPLATIVLTPHSS